MPRQRAGGRRGALRRSVLVLGLVVLMIALWLGANWLRYVADERAAERGRECSRGPVTLKVTVAPTVEEPLREIAGRWNASGAVVDDSCVKVTVAATESGAMLAGLTGEWNVRELGDRPHAWLPESSFWTDRLSAVDDALLGSAPDTVASSPIVLATPEPAAKALTDTVTFTWSDVATLIPDPSGWSRFGQSGWGRLIVALPQPAANPATGLAVQAVLSGIGKQSPLTHEVLDRPEVADAISKLTAGQPTGVPETTREALISLGEAETMTTAPFSAVPVLEVDLHRRNLAIDGRPAAKHPLFEVMPDGPIPTADFPFVRLAGIDAALANAADRFRQFLLEPDQQRSLGRAGLRTASNERPPRTLGIGWPDLPPATAPANPRTTQQLAATWAAAAEGGRIVTMLVDVSKSMGGDNGDGRTRMQWVQEALHGYANYTVSGSLGLWQFSQGLDRAKPYQQLVATGPIGDTRAPLHQAVDKLAPTGATHLHESIAAAYRAAINGYVAGKRNEIVVITDGGSDGDMTLAELTTAIKAARSTKKPVVISVITFGPDQNRTALRDIARLTGGTVSTLSSARGLQAALGQLAARRD
ncbi:von Willebrand factor type A domain-containing protein [Actinokineospora alba]|uniref:von Willebrand factor type A domain-containing protein n=1 Tax=Actinokineospora alba TaxID=504798 RepID=A0A1H0WNS1_9PSEU|nr:substrate-binding domain-containing protein [Actinokineospora alba]TDP68843.1 von Willebrand factor type A domain-containing protein [Actinokineospora alba]SDI73360.1 von Willebrand factor type A domain-containing protein [Actinokineospora alba]SDP92299.1 von Willebrand factor type A domain-containing protein [Actinokineospora alba]